MSGFARWFASFAVVVLGNLVVELSEQWPNWSWQSLVLGGLGFGFLFHFVERGLK